MGMPLVRNNPTGCHPERSTTASEASCRAQSTDPYAAATLSRRLKAFSPRCRRSAPDSPKLPDKIEVKSSGKGSFDSARSFEPPALRMTM